MPILDNQRHERFAQELAKGTPANQAYVIAGYRPSEPNASRLTRNDKVLTRIAELQGRAAKRAEVTVQTIAEELEEARKLAIAEKQSSAAVAASMGKAKLFGLIVEKHKHSGTIGTYDLAKLSDDELDRLEAILGPLADAGGDQGGEA